MRSLVFGVFFTGLIVLTVTGNTASARSFVYVSLLQKRQIVCFESTTSGSEVIRSRSTTDCPAEPAYLTSSRDQRFLFVSYRSSGELASFRIDPGTGALSPINVVPGGEDPAFLTTDMTGHYLITAYYVANKVTVHSVSEDGTLSDKPVCSIRTSDNAHGVAISPDNSCVYVSHTGANCIYQFRLNAETGMLTEMTPAVVMARAGQRPRHAVAHPTGQWIYCSNEAGDSQADGVSAWTVDKATQQLTLKQSISSVPVSIEASQNSTSECLMTPDGRFLFVANRGHQSLTGYTVDKSTGLLTLVGTTPTEAVPRSFAISRDGKQLFAAGEASGRLAVYQISDQGELKPVTAVESGPVSWGVTFVEPSSVSAK